MAITSDIAGVLQLIQSQQQAEERKEARQQDTLFALLGMEHQTSQMYLQHNLNMLKEQNTRKIQLEDEAMKLGLIGDKLEKIGDIDATDGASSVFRTSSEGLDSEIKNNESEILGLTTNIKNYYAGLNLAKNMDVDISGIVDPYELKDYFETSGLSPELSDNQAFLTGVQGYTLAPERMEALKKSKLAIQEAELRLDYLPGALSDDRTQRAIQIRDAETKSDFLKLQLIDEATLRTQKIDTGSLTLDILEEQKLQSEQQSILANQQMTLNDIQIDSAQESFRNTLYKNDAEFRKEHIISIEEMKINNIQSQSGIGAGILSNMSLELDKDTYFPMFTVLSGSTDDGYVGLISEADALENIKGEILELYSAYGIGKVEEMIPDYSFVLDKIEDIKGYRETYNEFGRAYDKELTAAATRMKRGKHSKEVMKEVAMHADPSLYPMDHMLKAIEWNNTGIYKNMELLENAVKAKEQHKEINATLERARGLDLSYTAEQTSGIYRETPLPPIQMRYGSTAKQSITPELQDSLYNIFLIEDKAGNLK